MLKQPERRRKSRETVKKRSLNQDLKKDKKNIYLHN
jgi:hypothetical protein